MSKPVENGFDFRDLFVLDMANNHQGDVEHGRRIIREMAEVVRAHGVRAGIKFQFRRLDTFIHPDHRTKTDNKHIPRFLSTRLDRPRFQALLDEVRAQGLVALCTPFDEDSVDEIVDMGFDVLKIASCSVRDWPLLEKAAEAGLPVIFSTGGATIRNIDGLVSFLEHRGVDFAIMHCVSVYPTPPAMCELNQIDALINRYPGRVIGWSTHESPADTAPVMIAVAKGARMFERHVGVAADKFKLNAYSSTPEQLDRWLASHAVAAALCGHRERPPASPEEQASLDGLRRGVYARRPIKGGSAIGRDQVYFAMPYLDGQLESGNWKAGVVAKAEVAPDAPLMQAAVEVPDDPDYQVIKTAVHEVKALLNEARVALNSEFVVEYSHHYGIPRFREVGAVIINCINRSYCKKLIVQLPGQKHPAHFHKLKEETFQVLHGILSISIEGHVMVLGPGETCLVQPGVWHSFWTDTGCVVEELSTTHYNDDSFYKDKAINRMRRSDRKTVVNHWGRFELMAATGGDGAVAD